MTDRCTWAGGFQAEGSMLCWWFVSGVQPQQADAVVVLGCRVALLLLGTPVVRVLQRS